MLHSTQQPTCCIFNTLTDNVLAEILGGMDLPDIELGPAMRACSEMERKFVWAYVTGDENATDAARAAGYVDSNNGSIRVTAHRLMHRDRVLAAMEEVGRQSFRGMIVPTLRATRALLDKSDHPDHVKTLNSMLSRLGFGERTGLDVTMSGQVTVSHTDQALEDLRALRAIGMPREKLIEAFGHSGLERYEKLLAIADQRAGVSRETSGGPVIEHEGKTDG